MQITLGQFLLALALAFLIGAALERGGTCTLGAVAEAVRHGRYARFIALMEAAFFASVGLAAAQATGLHLALPPNQMFGFVTLIGAAVLGFGAYVNGACPLGTIVHIGRGEVDFLMTPLGFYLGGSLSSLLTSLRALPQESCGAFRHPPVEIILVALCGVLARTFIPLVGTYRLHGAGGTIREALSPRHATIAAGLLSVSLMLLAESWTYTDLLLEVSNHMQSGSAIRAGFLFALFGGAIAAGVGMKKFSVSIPSPNGVVRRLAGGSLMGLGAFLVPGDHDSLIFMHLPLGRLFALCALLVICGVMAGSVLLGDRYGDRKES